MWTFRCSPTPGDTVTFSPSEVSKDKPPVCSGGRTLDPDKFKYSIETIHLWTLHRTSEEDPGTVQMSLYSGTTDSVFLSVNNEFLTSREGLQSCNNPSTGPGYVVATLSESSQRCLPQAEMAKAQPLPRSAYDQLAKELVMLHNRFIDMPDADNILIVADDHEAFDKIIGVMDRSRDAGFWKINLAKLGGE
jgi:hypothetical protein